MYRFWHIIFAIIDLVAERRKEMILKNLNYGCYHCDKSGFTSLFYAKDIALDAKSVLLMYLREFINENDKDFNVNEYIRRLLSELNGNPGTLFRSEDLDNGIVQNKHDFYGYDLEGQKISTFDILYMDDNYKHKYESINDCLKERIGNDYHSSQMFESFFLVIGSEEIEKELDYSLFAIRDAVWFKIFDNNCNLKTIYLFFIRRNRTVGIYGFDSDTTKMIEKEFRKKYGENSYMAELEAATDFFASEIYDVCILNTDKISSDTAELIIELYPPDAVRRQRCDYLNTFIYFSKKDDILLQQLEGGSHIGYIKYTDWG